MSEPHTIRNLGLSYRLIGLGWASATWSIEDSTDLKLGISYLSDGLGDMLRAVRSIVDGAERQEFFWEDEPGMAKFSLNRDGLGGVVVRVDWVDDQYPRDGECLEWKPLNAFRIDQASLVSAIIHSAQACLDEHGEAGYHDKWFQHPFPTEHLCALKRWEGR